MVEINWTVLTIFFVGLFAIGGFSRGWWKEAITTITVILFVLLLQNPDLAQGTVDIFNRVIEIIWGFASVIFSGLGDTPFQFEAQDPNTWLIILLVFLILANLLSRLFLPSGYRSQGYTYQTRPIGGLLGGILGGINGFLILSLVREYLDGRNLPGSGLPPTEVAQAQSTAFVPTASSGISLLATDVPSFTVFDSFIPWILLIGGGIMTLVAIRSRVGLHSRNGFRRVDYRAPFGYKRVDYKQQQ